MGRVTEFSEMHIAVLEQAQEFWEKHYLNFGGDSGAADHATYSWWLRFGYDFPLPKFLVYVKNLNRGED